MMLLSENVRSATSVVLEGSTGRVEGLWTHANL